MLYFAMAEVFVEHFFPGMAMNQCCAGYYTIKVENYGFENVFILHEDSFKKSRVFNKE
jgi:hypothetical protein